MRTLLVKAAGAALLVLTVGACASTVPGRGSFDTAAGPGVAPTAGPTGGPRTDPTTDRDGGPTSAPTGAPTSSPTGAPTTDPGTDPTGDPTGSPTGDPAGDPTGSPAGGDQQAVADVAERWYHALAERDASTVCGLMTSSAQRQTGSDCEKSVQDTDFTTAQRDAMRRIEVDPAKVLVSGDIARIPGSAFSVDGQASSSGSRLEAARDGGGWLIDDIG